MASHIVHLTTVHPRADVRIFVKECCSLKDSGYDVSLVVGDGLGDRVERGIKIYDIGGKPESRARRMLTQPLRAISAVRMLKPVVVHFHDPELIPVAIALRLLGYQVIYDVHEDVPRQILSKQWIPTPLRRSVALMARLFEWVGARLFSALVVATPKIAERFPSANTVVVQNVPILSELWSPEATLHVGRTRSFAYIGGITIHRGAREMVMAMNLLPADNRVCLELAGAFYPAELEASLANMEGWNRVRFNGQLGRQGVAQLLARVRAGLVLFHPEPNHVDAQPNKMFEYMSAGLPIIASDFPLWRQIIGSERCGLLVDPLDPRSIAGAMQWILDNPAESEAMGKRGRQAAERTYNWGNEREKLLKLYRTLVPGALL